MKSNIDWPKFYLDEITIISRDTGDQILNQNYDTSDPYARLLSKAGNTLKAIELFSAVVSEELEQTRQALKDLLFMREFDGTIETSIKRRDIKNKARNLLTKTESNK